MTTQDLREQLVNDRKTGTVAQVQLPLERITTLHGIPFDLDPKLYIPGNPLFPPADDPAVFFQNIEAVLNRHPLASAAEVRMTGTGLHVIVLLDPPVELKDAGSQRKWDALVRTVQCTLPVDPNAPGITALTRPIGSVNSKNGATVRVLRSGKTVAGKAVEEFAARLGKAPFKEVAAVLLGETRVSPCPVCQREGSRLDVLDRVGMCYACGKVTLAQILDRIYAPPPQASKDKTPAAVKKAEVAATAPAPAAGVGTVTAGQGIEEPVGGGTKTD
jgi:hypothetical protein